MKDLVAAWCSGLCVVHCLLTPALVLLGISGSLAPWLEQEWLHLGLLLPVVLLFVWSLPSARQCHGRNSPLLLAVPGLLLLLTALFMPEEMEAWFSIAGGVLLICGHLLNRQLLRQQHALSHC